MRIFCVIELGCCFLLNDYGGSGDELDECLCFLFGCISSGQLGNTLNPKLHAKNLIGNLDPSLKAVDYFQLFDSDIVLSELVKFANASAELKKKTEHQKNKGELKKLMLEEMKACYRLLIMKVILRLDCDAYY